MARHRSRGVTRFSQIAAWTPGEVLWIGLRTGVYGCVELLGCDDEVTSMSVEGV